MGMEIAGKDQNTTPNSQPKQSIQRAKRIIEKLFVEVDSWKSFSSKEVIAKYCFPQVLNSFNLCEKTMSANIKVVVLIINGPWDSTDYRIFFKNNGFHAGIREFIGSG